MRLLFRSSNRLTLALLPVVGLLLFLAQHARAVVLFSETFDTDGGPGDYPSMAFVNGTWTISSGAAHLSSTGINDYGYAVATIGPTGPNIVTLQGDVKGSNQTPGTYNVGLMFGNTDVVIHPDDPGGAFRIEFPLGSGSIPNTNMGFTPSAALWQHVIAVLTPNYAGGNLQNTSLNLTISEPADPSNIFSFNYTLSPALYDPRSSYRVGFFSASDSAPPTPTSFDNLLATAAPEPAAVLVWLGIIVVLAKFSRIKRVFG